MSEPILSLHKTDTTATGQLRVACSGPTLSRHPKVFLTMVDDKNGKPTDVVCPYCSHVFVYDAKLASHAAGH